MVDISLDMLCGGYRAEFFETPSTEERIEELEEKAKQKAKVR